MRNKFETIRETIIGRDKLVLRRIETITRSGITISYVILYNRKSLATLQIKKRLVGTTYFAEKEVGVTVKPSTLQKDIVEHLKKNYYEVKKVKTIDGKIIYYARVTVPYVDNFEELEQDLKQRSEFLYNYILRLVREKGLVRVESIRVKPEVRVVQRGKLMDVQELLRDIIVSEKRHKYEVGQGLIPEPISGNVSIGEVLRRIEKSKDKEVLEELAERYFYEHDLEALKEFYKRLQKLVEN